MREELFGDMTNLEILGEVVGGIAFIGLMGFMSYVILLL